MFLVTIIPLWIFCTQWSLEILSLKRDSHSWKLSIAIIPWAAAWCEIFRGGGSLPLEEFLPPPLKLILCGVGGFLMNNVDQTKRVDSG